jgi:outer membrane immunogenic protein
MGTSHWLSGTCATAALAIGVAVGLPPAARAQSQTDFAEMAAAMKRLEARVTVLEGENKQAKQDVEAARAEARALRQKLGGAAPPAVAPFVVPSPSPSAQRTYAMATKAPLSAPAPSWTGFYAGAGFGLGWMRGETTRATTDLFQSTFTQAGFTEVTTQVDNSIASLSGRNAGAIGNLYLGYNFVATPTVILGAQVEGGVANIRASLRGTTFESSTSTSVDTPPGGAAGTTTRVLQSTFDIADSLDNRWMVSVLGHGGVLVDPADYVYVLGGYTYARFETFNSVVGFGLNGGTIGAGWERQIAPGWSLRGEYRYTKFQGKDVTETFPTSTTQTTTGANANTQTTTDNFTVTNHFTADMHSLWISVVHYFDR